MADNDVSLILAVAVVVSLGLWKLWQKWGIYSATVDWNVIFLRLGIGIISIIVLFIFLIFIVKFFRQWSREKRMIKEQRENNLRNLNELLKFEPATYISSDIRKELQKILFEINKFSNHLLVENEEVINEFKEKWFAEIEERKAAERLQIKVVSQKRSKELAAKRKFDFEVKQLISFMLSKNSSEVLPLNHKYSEKVISSAKYTVNQKLYLRKRKKETHKEAIEYYKEHDLDTQPNIDEKDKSIYTEVRRGIKEGKIQLKHIIVKDGKPLPKYFYRSKDMTSEMKQQAIAAGYQHARGIELDGKICGGGFYLHKAMIKESNYHFVTKHLFAELHPKMQVEKSINGKRVDVALCHGKLRLGVEIETGTNKESQLVAKVQWLNKHFEHWIFVCSRKLLPKYTKYVDGKKSFCLPPKKSKEKVLQLCSSYNL
ncbi:hypothetical protein HOA92_04735 [archaeon]|jgi:hypothetical protein|nr:hypothetical protein [archaeon]MBT6762323.1 hypothetical protein [archaeon]